jgi:hypothetical protein
MSTVQKEKNRRIYLTRNIELDGRFPGQASLAYFFFFGSLLSLFVSVVDVCNEFAVIIG